MNRSLRRCAIAMLFLSAFAASGYAQGLFAASNLPMDREKIDSLSQSAASNRQQFPAGRTQMVDKFGAVDPREGEIIRDTLRGGKGRRLKTDSLLLEERRPLRYGLTLFQDADPALFASHAGAVGSDYQLGPGDEVILTLWGQKEGRYQLVLDRDGQVNLEGVGVVSLNGQSLSSATEVLRRRLGRIYSGMGGANASMDLTLGKLKQIRVYVVGNVRKPGSYLLSGNTTVLAALFQAKGPDEVGTERVVDIVRGKVRTKVDLYDYLFRGELPQVHLQDGDVVQVPPHGALVEIKGEVGRPAIYELTEKEGAKELLQYASGTKVTAAATNLLVRRVFENGRKDYVVLPTPVQIQQGGRVPLLDGDLVQVFEGKDPAKASVTVSGQVRFPGSYPLQAGMNAAELITLAGGPTRDAFQGRILLTRRLAANLQGQTRFLLDRADTCRLASEDSLYLFDVTELAHRDSVLITGAVLHPGQYPWREGMQVKDLVLMAGGGIWGADLSHVRLESPVEGAGSSIVVLEVDTSLRSGSTDHLLSPKSHVAIPLDPKARLLELVQVQGQVVQPGSYALTQNGERLSSLWKRIGGLRSEAYLGGAVFLRRTDSNISRIQIDFEKALSEKEETNDLALHAGDSIYVPARPATVSVKGRVNSPANILWREGKSWRWYVQQAGGFADSADMERLYVRYADGTIQTRDNGISDLPTPGSEVIVPFKVPPKATTMTDMLSGVNLILGTLIAGLTLYLLMEKQN